MMGIGKEHVMRQSVYPKAITTYLALITLPAALQIELSTRAYLMFIGALSGALTPDLDD